ncbi:MAG: DUF2029 domain-containing protein [Acetobacteraceae bacterium]|nr:DUF2029 domain-containing protein [Acetobacteraceae bacterium]
MSDRAPSAAGAALCGLGVVLLLGVVASRLVLPAGAYGDLSTNLAVRQIACTLAAGVVYLGAVALVCARSIPRWSLVASLAIALAARLVLLAAPPVMSTDLYRYVWDGRVQAAGINPYRYIPADPVLASLRDAGSGPEAIYSNINRAETAPTIYPPAAQMLFAAVGLTAPTIWTVKTLILVMDCLAGLAAWRLLRAAARPDAFVLIWAWNPLVIWEFSGSGHIDAAALAASGAALVFAAHRRPAAAGAALGVAVLFKLLPAALAPAIWRWRRWRAVLAALAVIALGYACYASAGLKVLGYLPGYAREEQLAGGGGFLLLRLLALLVRLPGWAAGAYLTLVLIFLAAIALAVLARPGPPADAEVIARQALLLAAALLLALSPHYPWYLTLAVLPATVVPRWGALWPSLAGPLLYLDFALSHPLWPAMVYLPMLAWLALELRKEIDHA